MRLLFTENRIWLNDVAAKSFVTPARRSPQQKTTRGPAMQRIKKMLANWNMGKGGEYEEGRKKREKEDDDKNSNY